MKIEKISVFGFEPAFRGMRNPKNSWDRSDSRYWEMKRDGWWYANLPIRVAEMPILGLDDLKLASTLIRGGSEHRKFLRQIMIWVDLVLPRAVWQELDTYKVATTRNSCSTMHTLGKRDLEQQDFEALVDETYLVQLNIFGSALRGAKAAKKTEAIRRIRYEYKMALPEGFLQRATYSMSYETALSMYFQRRKHGLDMWHAKNPTGICGFLVSLPYMSEFIAALETKDHAKA